MARPIVLSNGELNVGINKYGLVHDFYFPYVGLENHAAGQSLRHRVGVWIDGHLSWLDDDGAWSFTFRYPHQALIGHIVAKNEALGVLLEFDDFVDADMSAFMRNIHVVNLRSEAREIRLFMHQAFAIGDSKSNTDTAQYLPDSDALLHYRGRRAFVISGQVSEDQPFDQYTVGLFGIEGHESSYRDADDGELSFGNVEHGRVDSVLRFALHIDGQASERVHYWIAAGTSTREALYIHKLIQKEGVPARLHNTAKWWQTWLAPAIKVAERLPDEYQEALVRSAMIIKSQIDKRGAVIASTDTTMLNYSRDAYGYSWPRDGAYVLWPLIRMGYKDEAYRFFEFCRRGLHNNGYLMHKYRADGALGSSWHPYIRDGELAPPIQEDETALVLFVFSQFYHMHGDKKLLDDFYESMILPMANFMTEFIEPVTGLPKPTYDLWEEVFLTTTYTVSTVYAGLQAAVELAEAVNDNDSAVKWKLAAESIYDAAHKHLYNSERNYFYKGIIVKDGEIHRDDTIDISAFFGAFIYGLFPLNEPQLPNAHQAIIDRFGERALPRYENDNYQRCSPDSDPNPWFITTLWRAQYNIEINNKDEAYELIRWAIAHASETGIMSEQLDPYTGERKSVEPLTWSHAELISALLDTITEHHE